MSEEIWLTRLFNDHLAGFGNLLLSIFRQPESARPWANFIVMQLLVVAIIVVLFAILKPKLSVDKPGKLQQTFELIYEFVNGQADDMVGHDGHKHTILFGTLFVFILLCNLIGIIPGLQSPTQVHYVPAGCAIVAFVYYNVVGIVKNGPLKYLGHFAGPIWWMSPLMFIIEIISHLARPLSLTIRLFANMYAGEQVTLVFLSLTYFIAPVIFMGLHVFVSLLQAYIFMLLTMMYVGGAVAEEH
ncbi:MAG TPA: F0F1 ATP synthase subunit A [Bryobacteraceae bacterium]|jgi:F-type H+-transporting ATPase subunit a